MTTSNATSVITNGKTAPKVVKAAKEKALRTTTLANPANGKLTEPQALDIGFEYGSSMAGVDGSLTRVLRQFNRNKAFTKRLIEHVAAGYYVRKLDYDKDRALATAGLMKYNKDHQTDDRRTLEEERIMVSVRMLVSRAKQLAGITDPEQQARQEKATATKEETKREAKALEARRQEAWEIVHPTINETLDVNIALQRLVGTIRSFMNEHSARITGDTGSAWREWLGKAPKIAK